MEEIHKHHIIPKHAGGTNDPSNLVELTVLDHAIAHKVLYGFWKREEDLLAWQSLRKGITSKEVILAVNRLPSRRKAISDALIGKPKPYMTERNLKDNPIRKPGAIEKIRKPRPNQRIPKSESHRKALAESNKRQHRGFILKQRKWITNGVDNLIIDKQLPIPEGYRSGRTLKRDALGRVV